jgi:hypothetical protein
MYHVCGSWDFLLLIPATFWRVGLGLKLSRVHPKIRPRPLPQPEIWRPKMGESLTFDFFLFGTMFENSPKIEGRWYRAPNPRGGRGPGCLSIAMFRSLPPITISGERFFKIRKNFEHAIFGPTFKIRGGQSYATVECCMILMHIRDRPLRLKNNLGPPNP